MIQQTSKAGKQGLGGHVGGEEGQWGVGGGRKVRQATEQQQ